MRHRVTIDVVPSSEQQVTGGRNGGKPLAHVVDRQDMNVAAIGVHAVQRVAVPALAELRAEAA